MDLQVASKINKFFNQYKIKKYKKGEMIIRPDEEPKGVYYLQAGIVKQLAISKNGEEIVINIYKAPSFFPMNWVINDSTNTFFYEALTDIETSISPKKDFLKFFIEDSEIIFDLIKRIYRGMDGLFTKLVYLMSGDAQTRLIVEILIQAKRFGINDRETGKIKIAITEKNIASQTGLTRETVSRMMKKLKDKNLILLTRNTIHIKDISLLEAELT